MANDPHNFMLSKIKQNRAKMYWLFWVITHEGIYNTVVMGKIESDKVLHVLLFSFKQTFNFQSHLHTISTTCNLKNIQKKHFYACCETGVGLNNFWLEDQIKNHN